MSERIHLSVTVGPVQAFVAQARRTRDLWAGSWLLSFLSETALAAAENTGGITLIPYRQKEQHGKVSVSAIGGYPNWFELSFDSQKDAERGAELAIENFYKQWRKIAAAVWQSSVEPVVEFGHKTKAIWQRQIEAFWEISWIINPPDKEKGTIGDLMAIRKNLRNVSATEEPGTKCSLIPVYQEISGHFGHGHWEKQKGFWKELAKNVPKLDVKEGERLCAIALIKRLFPRVIDKAVGENVSNDLKRISVPSTAFMAALPWLKQLGADSLKMAKQYADDSVKAGYEKAEYKAARNNGIDWASPSGNIWFISSLRQNEPKLEDKAVQDLIDQLKSIYQHTDDKKPVPFYAMLLMDGDSMGSLLKHLGNPTQLSQCLGTFSEQVDRIINHHSGWTVYAGGDDVMALLPSESALIAADQLRIAYQNSFVNTPASDIATISGAIVYSHYHYPLLNVLSTAHHLLDDIAKDKTGRDALAIGIIPSSGLNTVWSVPWSVVQGEPTGCQNLGLLIDQFDAGEQDYKLPHFNASYLYLLQEQFIRLFDQVLDYPGEYGTVTTEPDMLLDLANSEYRRRMNKEDRLKHPPETTKEKVRPLMTLSQQWLRKQTDSGFAITSAPSTFSFDGWRAARFLKQIKEGKVADHD